MNLKNLVISEGGSYPRFTLTALLEDAVSEYPLFKGFTYKPTIREEYEWYKVQDTIERMLEGTKPASADSDPMEEAQQKVLDSFIREWTRDKETNIPEGIDYDIGSSYYRITFWAHSIEELEQQVMTYLKEYQSNLDGEWARGGGDDLWFITCRATPICGGNSAK